LSNYWENNLYPQFLQSVDSCTLSDLTSYEIQSELAGLAVRAVNDFKFPLYSLSYLNDALTNPDTGLAYGYYFVSDSVGQKEFNVILARMKQYWIEFQISQERMFANAYYDKDIRLHSPGNTIDKLIKMLTTFKAMDNKAECDYGRQTDVGDPSIGEINE